MTIKLLTIALLAGFISMSASAGFEQFGAPFAENNVWGTSLSGGKGGWIEWQSSTLNDLQALTTDNRTFVLKPNINLYGDGTDPYWANIPAQDGNKWLEASCLYRQNPIEAGSESASFSFTVSTNDLDARYEVQAFLRVRDPFSDWVVLTEDIKTITTNGTYSLSIPISSGYAGLSCDAGWVMDGLNANPATNWGAVTVTAAELLIDIGDLVAPNPDPMEWEIAPASISDQAISMTASNATDVSGVEYFFTCASGDGNDSGWQSETTYVDSGLVASSNYSYTVMARDLSPSNNTTAASSELSATTNPTDTDVPSPSPMTFAAAPEVSTVSIIMTATTATDASAVEYNFESTAGGGPDSGWQSSPTYVATNLTAGSNYLYTVTARDLSAAMNTTLPSAPVSVTTQTAVPWMVNSLTGYTNDTEQLGTVFSLELDSLGFGTPAATAAISFDGSGATFGEGTDYHGRNILRSIAENCDDTSFEAYATFAFDGTDDQAAFMGLGNGIISADVSGNYGVPELALGGVNGLVAEMKTSLSAGAQNVTLLKINDGMVVTNYVTDPLATIDTFRVKLAYDADAETATLSVDTEYTGGAFSADRVLGTVDTSGAGGTNMWFGSPVRVYVGGGEGTVVSDLLIVNLNPEPVTVAISAGGGAVISWDGEAAQTYNVQYKTDLVNDSTWTTDPSSGCSDIFAPGNGTLSATSTISGAANFYQVISQ